MAEWKPVPEKVDMAGQGLWKKGQIQCIMTYRRLSITHNQRPPEESEVRDALSAFWPKVNQAEESVMFINTTVGGTANRVVHVLRQKYFDGEEDYKREFLRMGIKYVNIEKATQNRRR